MAYKSEAVCDLCGDAAITYINQTASITKMRKIAKQDGWFFTDDMWICPDCERNAARIATMKHCATAEEDSEDDC